jgi:hypothetical protein
MPGTPPIEQQDPPTGDRIAAAEHFARENAETPAVNEAPVAAGPVSD